MLQLLALDVGVNNITGTLPNSWSNLTQASKVTTLCILLYLAMHNLTLQSSTLRWLIQLNSASAAAGAGLEQQSACGQLAWDLEQPH